MRFSLQLIGQYVDLTGVDHVWLVEQVTRSVAEVESRTALGDGLEGIRIARIVTTVPHPTVPSLTVCEVDDGEAIRTVVCGAPNARPGLVSAFAPPGSSLAGRAIVERSVHGVHSQGMLCSPKELELTDAADIICELPDEALIGHPLSAVLPVRDTVFEVDNKSLTHRPDLWGHVGMAREVAAILRRPLRLPGASQPFGSEEPARITSKRQTRARGMRCSITASPRSARRRSGCRSPCTARACAPSRTSSISQISS